MTHFKEYVDGRDFGRIERCLSLLNHLLDASETKGIGRLRSHGAQLRGSPLNVNIHNNIPKSEKAKKSSIVAHTNDTLWEVGLVCLPVSFSMSSALSSIFSVGKNSCESCVGKS